MTVRKQENKTKKKSTPHKLNQPQSKSVSKATTIRETVITFAAIYLLLVVFFSPVVFKGYGLSPAADMVAAAGMHKTGEAAIADGRFPLWNPTLFCGLPMFASLQYALFTYPPEYPIRLLSFIFGSGDYRIWLFHYFLAAIFAFLLARHYGCSRIAAWLAGVAYGFSPQLIVLADVGHGSKLMGMTYLPLIWLMLDRLRRKPSAGRAAALGAVYAVEVLALHPQVAAYGGLMMGVYLLYYGVSAFLAKRKQQVQGEDTLHHNPEVQSEDSMHHHPTSLQDNPVGKWIKLSSWWVGSMVVALLVSAVLWMSVMDYMKYSVRGSAAAGELQGGTGTWEYATGWSFHPVETITFIFPSFMGFGGQTYWGTVGTPLPNPRPFTHNPMYFGCVVLFLAIVAMTLHRKTKWGFPLTLALIALTISFGRYLPILYGPLYNLMPFFDKFRAPVMTQVLVVLSMSLLSAMGFDTLLQMAKDKVKNEKAVKGLFITAGVFGLLALFALMGGGAFKSMYYSIARSLTPDVHGNVLSQALQMAQTDVAKSSGLIILVAVVGAMALRGKVAWQALAGIVALAMIVDLYPVNRQLIGEQNFTPKSYGKLMFQEEYVVKKLKKETTKYRIHLIDSQYRASNWWSYFGIESTAGYFGAKMAQWQQMNEAAGLDGWDAIYSHPKLMDAMNVRYVISSYPMETLFGELQKRGYPKSTRPAKLYRLETMPRDVRGGSGAFVYRNLGELPRARLVGEYRMLGDRETVVNTMMTGNWDPAREALLEEQPEIKPQPGEGSAEIVTYEPEHIVVKTSSEAPQILILADSWYPSGWTVKVDGGEVPILRTYGLLRAVALPAGNHEVVFTFRPPMFYAGLWVSLASVIGMLGWLVFWVVSMRKVREKD